MLQLCSPVMAPVSARRSRACSDLTAAASPFRCDTPRKEWMFAGIGFSENTRIPNMAYGTHSVTAHRTPSTLTRTTAPETLLYEKTGHVKNRTVITNMTLSLIHI